MKFMYSTWIIKIGLVKQYFRSVLKFLDILVLASSQIMRVYTVCN